MNTLIVALLVILIAVVLYGIQRRPSAPAAGSTTDSVSRADLEAALSDAHSKALTAMMAELRKERESLADESRKSQAESIRLATESIVKSGADQLGSKAEAIDVGLRAVADSVSQKLKDVDTAINNLREMNSQQYGSVERAVEALTKRTDNLNDVLSNSQARGQWGERLAEDMLRAAGFVEGVNYEKQATIEIGRAHV